MIVEKFDTFSGHRDSVFALAKGNDNNQFFSSGADGLVVRWNIEKPDVGELFAKIPTSVYALAYDDINNHLWIGQNFDGIQVLDILNKREIGSLKITSSSIFVIKLLDNQVFVGLSDGTVVVIDKQTLLTRKHIKASDKSVRAIDVNPKTQEIAIGYSDFTVKIFDLIDFSLKLVLQAHTNSVFALKYSPDFNFLLSGGRDAHLKVWNVASNYQLQHDIVAHLFAINDICYHPTLPLFATCSMDKSIKVWDGVNFKLKKVIDKARHASHGTSVNKLLWLKESALLVSGSDDRNVSVWKIS
ncbi:MAG: WD40 repeat domain-containing protein [Flectobacillus sp.]|uniref:WD40 repeat domain-containing protein n=1 Tax=Flectobacillus sp. TaxID=50419 RepID=UPI003B9D4C12